MLKLVVGLASLAVVVVGGIAFAADEDNANALASSAGFIREGSKFGIRVGDHISAADWNARQHHFQLYSRDDLQTCLSQEYPATEAIVVYKDDSWRRGTVCVAFNRRSGKIAAVEWSYAAFMVDL